ncbi:MAG: hypothetical protein JWL95_252, partial [Gemmatimonadetes bacterium]|nr:hypothetical protein [Gemmatimonadota bacterium]
MIRGVRSIRSWTTWREGASRYSVAVAATLLAFAGTDALRHLVPTPTFLFFIPAVVLAAWYGGAGPSVTAIAMSLLIIEFYLTSGSLQMTRALNVLDVLAFLVIGITITIMMEGMRRARRLAESHSTKLERLNDELTQVASRGTKLVEVITALSQARYVGDVVDVVFGKGLALLEASRGILVYTDGDHPRVLGMQGMGPEFQELVDAHGHDADLAVMEAIRTNEEIWIGSATEYRERFPWASEQPGEHRDLRALCALPLIYAGETIGGLAMGFSQPEAFG